MRVLRAKQIRKYLKFYKIVFGIDPPYHIILDGNFIYSATKNKIDIRDRLSKILQGEMTNIYVTRSVLNELSAVGEKAATAFQFARECCTLIEDGDIVGETPAEKLQTFLRTNNSNSQPHRRYYMVMTQDKDLRNLIAKTVPGVPLLYLNQVTFVLEPPSDLSRRGQSQIEKEKTEISTTERELLNELRPKRSREETPEEGKSEITQERKKRKATAPNPLSLRKPSENSKSTQKKKLGKYLRGK